MDHGRDALIVELAALATTLAAEAAALLLDGLTGARASARTKSSATDLVTATDHAAEALIVGRLRVARPADAILAEEGAQAVGQSGLRWVIDPLDGTTNFFYGHPGFAVSIAVEDDDGPLIGVVTDPLRGDRFSAVRGRGAFHNGERISCRQLDRLDLALLATGFGYRAERRAQQGAVVARLLPRVRDIRRVGSAALDLCSVACGRVDAYYERGLSPWDLAAGDLIAREAGALVTNLAGGRASGEAVVAAGASLHPLLLAALSDAGALEPLA